MIANDVKLGKNVNIPHPDLVNLYGCEIGDNSTIGPFTEIAGAKIGKNCKIQSHSYICEGVTIEDNCFVGHGVVFINDLYPQATNDKGELEKAEDWKERYVETHVQNNVSIGSNSTILGGIEIANNAVVGAGSMVIENIYAGTTVVGNPAKVLKKKENLEERSSV